MTPVLRSPRLILEPYVRSDEQDFVDFFQDTRVSRWMGDGPSTEAEDRALFGRIFSVYTEDLFDVWAVRHDGAFVGHAELKRTDTVDGHELIYALLPSQWGQGLGTELAEVITAHGFRTSGLTEIYATVHEDNRASLAVLRKAQFEHLRDITNDDGDVTVVLMRRAPNR